MPTVPLGMKAYRRTDGFVPEVVSRNMYVEKDESGLSPDNVMRIQRPGLVRQYALPGGVRGMEYRTAKLESLSVSGQQLYSGPTSKGGIPGTDRTPMASTTFTTAIVADGGLYLYDESVTPLATPNDPFTDASQAVQDVDQLNQYVLVLMSNGRFYWIVPGETDYDPLNFATAESSPDQGVALCRIGDEFWIFGSETIEVWQSTGDLDAPFQRVSGRYYERGCLARDTVRRFDNSVMWVSEDGQVCRGGAVPQVVSDNGIAERIRKRTGEPSAWTFGLDGHDFYVLNIPGQGTFAYDALTQAWCEFASLGQTGWQAITGYDAAGMTLVGGLDGGIYTLDPEAGTDDGTPIERAITGTLGFMGRAGRNDSISIGVGSSADCTLRLRWKDGQDDFPDYYDEVDVRAPTDVAVIRRMGVPLQPYRTIEVSCVDAARIRIAGCSVNDGWGR